MRRYSTYPQQLYRDSLFAAALGLVTSRPVPRLALVSAIPDFAAKGALLHLLPGLEFVA